MTRIRLRFSLSAWEGLPAFQAGLFVVTAIVASLVNFGVIALVLVARMTYDVVLATTRGAERKAALYGVIRGSLLDILLLVYGINLAVYAATPPVTLLKDTVDIALWTVLVGTGFLVAKMAILYRSYRHVVITKNDAAQTGPLSNEETTLIFLIFAGVLALIASPRLITGGARNLLGILRRQIIPWRL
ncbi:MAG: hypothetical protein WCV62_03370 [Candidatus Peribacteraceae bacterium]|jgi:hypothetical protein